MYAQVAYRVHTKGQNGTELHATRWKWGTTAHNGMEQTYDWVLAIPKQDQTPYLAHPILHCNQWNSFNKRGPDSALSTSTNGTSVMVESSKRLENMSQHATESYISLRGRLQKASIYLKKLHWTTLGRYNSSGKNYFYATITELTQ